MHHLLLLLQDLKLFKINIFNPLSLSLFKLNYSLYRYNLLFKGLYVLQPLNVILAEGHLTLDFFVLKLPLPFHIL